MNVVGKKPWIVNVLSFAMAVCISVTSLLSSGLNTKIIVASADTSAKSRVQTFIGLAAGKSGNALPDIGQLTQDELQFLGVYLSNFYVPFMTELGQNVSNEDILTTQKEKMVQALSTNLNFNETVINELIDNIFGLARSNNRELEFRVSNMYQPSASGSYKVLDGFEVNYYTFVNCMTGGMFDLNTYDATSGYSVFGSGMLFAQRAEGHNAGFYLGSKWLVESSSTTGGSTSGGSTGSTTMTSEEIARKVCTDLVNEGFGCFFVPENFVFDSSGNVVAVADAVPFYEVDKNDVCTYVGEYLANYHDDSMACSDEFISRFSNISSTSGSTTTSSTSSGTRSITTYTYSFPYNYGYFGYTDDLGNFVPMFDCAFNGKSTACMDAFALCLNNVDTDNGYALNFFDMTDDEVEGKSLGDVESTLDGYSNTVKYQASQYATKMYVDCFGDILALGNNHQYVAIPGCLNPYTWVHVDDNGNDISTGSFRYVINAFDIGNFGFVPGGTPAGYAGTSVFNIHYLNSKNLQEFYNSFWGSGANRYESIGLAELGDGFAGAFGHLYGFLGLHILSTLSVPTNDINIYAFGLPWHLVRGSSGTLFPTEGGSIFVDVESGAGGVKPYMWLYTFGGYTYCASEWSFSDNKLLSAMPAKVDSGSATAVDNYLYIDVLSKMCTIDNLGAFGFDSSNSDVAYDAIQFIDYLDDNSSPLSEYTDWTTAISSNFSSLASKVQAGSINDFSMTDICAVSLYTTYAMAGLYIDDADSKKNTIGHLNVRMNREKLPSITNAPLTFSSSYADESLKKEILNMIYYALKPDGIEYIKVAIRNKVNAILVDWHNNMVGTNGVGYTTGTTYYRTNYGYVTTPDLSEMQWTSSLLNLYNSLIPMLVVFMVVSMLVSFIIGTMSLQRAVLGTLVFSAFLLVPVNAINFVVEKSNNITNNIYGEKFVYWAVVQEETFGTALDTAATGESYENYIKTLYSTNSANQGGESIVVRWQAPKKMASLMLSSGDTGLLSSLQGSLLSGKFLNNALDGQAYLDGDSQYLYRDYSDLANMSRYIYNSIANTGKRKVVGTTVVDPGYGEYFRAGYTNGTDSTSDSLVLKSMYTKIYDDVTTDTILDRIKSGNIDQNSYLGINQDLFNVSVAYFNNTQEGTSTGTPQELYFDTAILNNASPGNETGVECLDDWLSRYHISHDSTHTGEEKWNSLMVYGIMSESPYYYFSWNMYDDDMNSSANASGGYRQMILGDGEGKYFYNMSGNGELKDFMNMRNFFYNVLPYLKKGNDIVRAFDERYGIFIYDGVPTDEGYLNDYTIQGDATLKYKYWHNLNVARLYEIYTPWLDLMYDCSYAKPCYVKALGEKYWVEDPLNPASYPAERPMIFSESEMLDYGLSEADLTEVERKILKFNREAQSDMYELLNYYNFSDLSLNTAAAMECTFIFNQVFSENGFFSSNINLYPQSFEIKDFSYDAFLRFILSTTTGEGMNASKDFYSDVVAKSSTTTAILLIVCDVLSQYVTPFAKVVFLIAIFVSAILLIMVTVFKVDPEFKFVKKLSKEIFVPLLEFFAITVLFAYVVSLFMGTGNNAVTQTADLSISLGDPNMVLIAMCVIDVVCIVLYCKLLLEIWSCIKQNASLVKNHVTGLVGGVVSIGAAGVSHIAGGFSKGSDSSGSGRSVGGGVGNESSRAAARASKRQSEVAEKADMGKTETERMSESRRATMKKVDSVSDEKRSKEINATIENGKKKTNSENQGNEKK